MKVQFVDPAGNTVGWANMAQVPAREETVLFGDGDVLRVTGVLWQPYAQAPDADVVLRLGTVGGVM